VTRVLDISRHNVIVHAHVLSAYVLHNPEFGMGICS
jgi:hypothetical protein